MRLLGAFCLAAAVSVTPLHAESNDLAVQAIHNFAACVVDRNDRGPVALLAMDPQSPAYRQAMSKLAKGFDYCAIGHEIRFNGVLFAGGLAERMIENSMRPASMTAALAYDPARPAVVARDDADAIALCVARTAPAGTAALFATEPATPDEERALKALGPTLVGCVSAGQQLKVNRPGLRAIIAISAFRLIQNNRPDLLPAVGS